MKNTFLFDKTNWMLLYGGLALIVLGFLLMMGGGSEDPNVFNEDIFNYQRIGLAPLLIVIGFVVEVYAILRKPKAEQEAE